MQIIKGNLLGSAIPFKGGQSILALVKSMEHA